MPLYQLDAGFDMEGMDAKIVALISAPNPEAALKAGRAHLKLKEFGLLWGPVELKEPAVQRKRALAEIEKQMTTTRDKINALTQKLKDIQHNYDISQAQGY